MFNGEIKMSEMLLFYDYPAFFERLGGASPMSLIFLRTMIAAYDGTVQGQSGDKNIKKVRPTGR